MDKVLGVFIFVKGRLTEPSTMASLSSVCTMAGIQLNQGAIQDGLVVLGLVFGALGFFVKEAKPLTNV